MDKHLIEYSIGLNNKYKNKRYLFRKVVSKLLPKIILNKKKQGFTLPISNWFANKEFILKIEPHIESLKGRGFFNNKEIDKILKNPAGFRNDHRLWVLLNLEIWCRIFLDGEDYRKIEI